MKRISLTEFKNNLSALIDSVVSGQHELLVTDRNRPVIRVVLAVQGPDDPPEIWEADVARLEREGIVRKATSRISPEKLKKLAIKTKTPASALRALLEEREEGF
jgi:prevent-host-death family protein